MLTKETNNPLIHPEPTNASIEDITMSSFTVNLGGYIGSPDVNSFIVHAKGGADNKTCKLTKKTGSVTCPTVGLSPGTKYNVNVTACLPWAFGCSDVVKMVTWTVPSRMFRDPCFS